MRLTLDIDDTSDKIIGELVKMLEAGFGGHDIEIYKTIKGYHLIVYDTGLTYAQVLKLREFLGDDKNRIKLDKELTDKPKQVLFTVKNGHQRQIMTKDGVILIKDVNR